MALTQIESGGIKDDAVIASKVAADAVVIADLAATGTASNIFSFADLTIRKSSLPSSVSLYDFFIIHNSISFV